MIEFRRRRLLMDGRPAVLLAGEVHYFRLPRAEWEDRLDRAMEIGIQCVASYIPWLFHELPDGVIDVSGRTRPERDLGAFLDLCAVRGLTFLARPGPFVMAELKNEGLPYRVYTEHPEIVPVGWDGAPAISRTVDYLAPAFLAEVERWYAAVMPLLAARLSPRGGPVIGVQLDNEIGMLAWITNSPDLTDRLVADLRCWAEHRYGERFAARYPVTSEGWATAVRSPGEKWAAALRVDLGWFMRDRFAEYVSWLAACAGRHGIAGVPFLINVHGTVAGDGTPIAVGLSQLYTSYAGRDGFVAGTDHYLGEMTPGVTADLHFANAASAALNGPDQPLTSLEFEAGTGDYGGSQECLYDPATTELKTRLFLAQGNRLINYYLLAGGINPRLDAPIGDGNDRISSTGERHGTAAPIGPRGERGLAFAPTAAAVRAVRANAGWLADLDEERDDLTVGFWPDAFLTEYVYPGSAIMRDLVDDLVRYRGPGVHRALWRSLLLAGFRFGATNLQDPGAPLPHTLALSTGRVLDRAVQQRLVDHVRMGGSLLLTGRLPREDTEGRPCTVLADTLGLGEGDVVVADHQRFPSVIGAAPDLDVPETRVSRLVELVGQAEPLLTDLDGRPCVVRTDVGPGSAIVATVELPADPSLTSALLGLLGTRAGLELRTTVPGVVATTGISSAGERMLHLINPTGYPADVSVTVDDPTGLLARPLRLPARTGRMLGLGLRLPGGGRIAATNAEVTAVTERGIDVSAGLCERTEVWLDTDRPVRSDAVVSTVGSYTVVTGPANAHLSITFGR